RSRLHAAGAGRRPGRGGAASRNRAGRDPHGQHRPGEPDLAVDDHAAAGRAASSAGTDSATEGAGGAGAGAEGAAAEGQQWAGFAAAAPGWPNRAERAGHLERRFARGTAADALDSAGAAEGTEEVIKVVGTLRVPFFRTTAHGVCLLLSLPTD